MNTDLNSLISQAVAQTLTPEFVEKEVKSRVEKLITETINSALRTYSDTGKMIEKAVTEALKVDRLDLPSYGLMVGDMLKAQIEALVSPLIAGRLAEDMTELLGLAPKEVTLSSIVAEMAKIRADDGGYGENLVTCIVGDNSYGSTWIYLDDREHHTERDKYQCAFRILVDSNGTISAANLRGCDYKTSTPSKGMIGRAYGFEQRFRAMIACQTKFIIDENNVNTGWEE